MVVDAVVSGTTGSAPGADPAEKSGRIRSRSRIRSNAQSPVVNRSTEPPEAPVKTCKKVTLI